MSCGSEGASLGGECAVAAQGQRDKGSPPGGLASELDRGEEPGGRAACTGSRRATVSTLSALHDNCFRIGTSRQGRVGSNGDRPFDRRRCASRLHPGLGGGRDRRRLLDGTERCRARASKRFKQKASGILLNGLPCVSAVRSSLFSQADDGWALRSSAGSTPPARRESARSPALPTGRSCRQSRVLLLAPAADGAGSQPFRTP
jgi:hypothetical protein